MGVQDALGLPGGARGVAQTRGGVLIELGPVLKGAGLAKQCLVTQSVFGMVNVG
ncbi:hypothetical protein D3C71_1403500 [compost metagenome]